MYRVGVIHLRTERCVLRIVSDKIRALDYLLQDFGDDDVVLLRVFM